MMHRFVAAAVIKKLMRTNRAARISGTLNGPHAASNKFSVSIDGKSHEITDARVHEGKAFLRIDGETYSASTDWRLGEPVMHLHEKDSGYAVQLARVAGGYRVRQGGAAATVVVRNPLAAGLAALMPKKAAADTSKFLLCPMPGLVVSVNVKEGQDVKAGESLAVVEAMKMENVLTAERDGKIKKVNAKKGDSLALDDVIIEFA
jgi:propionyl-CoA carboxylase alpha chain